MQRWKSSHFNGSKNKRHEIRFGFVKAQADYFGLPSLCLNWNRLGRILTANYLDVGVLPWQSTITVELFQRLYCKFYDFCVSWFFASKYKTQIEIEDIPTGIWFYILCSHSVFLPYFNIIFLLNATSCQSKWFRLFWFSWSMVKAFDISIKYWICTNYRFTYLWKIFVVSYFERSASKISINAYHDLQQKIQIHHSELQNKVKRYDLNIQQR